MESWLDIRLDKLGQPLEPTHTNLKVNLQGSINTTILALHHLRQQATGGAIILTASASSKDFSSKQLGSC